MVSTVDTCKRLLVNVIRTLAGVYGCCVTVTRESSDADVKKAFRKLSKKTHPDHGGSTADQQRLNSAYEDWCKAVQEKGSRGRPSKEDRIHVAPPPKSNSRANVFTFRCQAVLLTYQGFTGVLADAVQQWGRFLVFVKGSLRTWGATLWTATLETNENGNGKHHAHLMLQFTKRVERTTADFAFEGLRPHPEANDLLGESWSKKRWQTSVDRGHFYCYANKKGTVRQPSGELCVAANYFPAWLDAAPRYTVLGAWPERLWKGYKLDSDVYEEYLHLCRDGLPSRKRNFEAYKTWAEEREQKQIVEAREVRIRSNPSVYTAFAEVPEAQAWLQHFRSDALRYPFLMVHGPSLCGKTEWACSLFEKPLKLQIGDLSFFPNTMRQFDRNVHDALVLDDVRDLEFLNLHQEKLQGKNGLVEFGSSPCGKESYKKDLYCLPIVVTVNNDTKNLDYLLKKDFLANRSNRVVLSFRGKPGDAPPTTC